MSKSKSRVPASFEEMKRIKLEEKKKRVETGEARYRAESAICGIDALRCPDHGDTAPIRYNSFLHKKRRLLCFIIKRICRQTIRARVVQKIHTFAKGVPIMKSVLRRTRKWKEFKTNFNKKNAALRVNKKIHTFAKGVPIMKFVFKDRSGEIGATVWESKIAVIDNALTVMIVIYIY